MEEKKQVNPGCWLTFIFSVFMWIFVMDCLGLLTGDNYLLIGCIMLVTLPIWVKGADLYYKSGNAVLGHYYMVFGVMFGGLVATAYIVLYFSHAIPGLMMDERIFGVIYLVAGLFLTPLLPSFLYMDKINMVIWTVCTIWFFVGGIYYFHYTTTLYWVNAICSIIVAIGVTYMMFNEVLLMGYGKTMPMGKPLK